MEGLIIVDVQRDFCENGTLPAVDTGSLLQPLYGVVGAARGSGTLVVFTQDWHPTDHHSFAPYGGPWPVHCVAGSVGAELMPPLVAVLDDVVMHKGTTCDNTGYSAFEATGLALLLRRAKIKSVAVCGIATEYCVRATALDAVKAGFRTAVLTDLIRAVDHTAADDALGVLGNAGIELIKSADWLKLQ